MSKLKDWYSGLQDRERRMVGIGGVLVVVLVLVFGILVPVQAALSGARHAVETKRDDLAWMRSNAAEVRAAGNQVPADTGEAPVVLVDRIGREAGLGEALRGTQPSNNGARVQLEGASFDTMIEWIASLDQRYGFAVDAITVDRAGKPGLVNASITFTQSRH
jgi:general secretion pathway protein M